MRTLRSYLEVARFTVLTDRDALRWTINLSDASGQLQRWRWRISEFEFDIIHRPVIKHQAADTLSRIPTAASYDSPLDD